MYIWNLTYYYYFLLFTRIILIIAMNESSLSLKLYYDKH